MTAGKMDPLAAHRGFAHQIGEEAVAVTLFSPSAKCDQTRPNALASALHVFQRIKHLFTCALTCCYAARRRRWGEQQLVKDCHLASLVGLGLGILIGHWRRGERNAGKK